MYAAWLACCRPDTSLSTSFSCCKVKGHEATMICAFCALATRRRSNVRPNQSKQIACKAGAKGWVQWSHTHLTEPLPDTRCQFTAQCQTSQGLGHFTCLIYCCLELMTCMRKQTAAHTSCTASCSCVLWLPWCEATCCPALLKHPEKRHCSMRSKAHLAVC